MFPRGFYQDEKRVGLQRTAKITKLFSSPVDLVTNSRPWLMVKPASLQKEGPKKTLIFADHLYAQRSNAEKRRIFSRLSKAREEGFAIYYLSGQGVLQEWDGKLFPSHYSLSLNAFTKETIQAAAWNQRALQAKKIVILDYFGINELEGKEKNQVRWRATSNEHSENLYQLMRGADLNAYHLVFRSAQEVDQFLSLDEDKRIQLLAKVKALTFEGIDFLKIDSAKLLAHATAIEGLDLYQSSHVELFIKNLNSDQRKKLRKISLVGSQVDRVATDSLFTEATDIEELTIAGRTCNDLRPYDEMIGKLKNIRKMEISEIELVEINVAQLASCEKLEEFFLGQIRMSNFEMLLPNQLKCLKKAKFLKADLSSDFLIKFLPAAPQLVELYLDTMGEILSWALSLKPGGLKALRGVGLALQLMNNQSVAALLRSAPQLQTLNIKAEKVINEIDEAAWPPLLHLRALRLASNASEDFGTLLRAYLNQLEKLTLSSNNSAIEYFPRYGGEKLKQLNLFGIKNLGGRLITILRLAIQLEELNALSCGDLTITFKLLSASLKNLRKVSLYRSTLKDPGLQALLSAAPYLTDLSLDKIDLRESLLSMEQMLYLLSIASEVRELRLGSCHDLPGLLGEVLDLDHENDLREVELRGTNVSPAELVNLFNRFPKIEKLTLVSCKNINGAFLGLSPGQLSELKTLDLSHSDFSEEDLLAILAAAPKLETLVLRGCKNILNCFKKLNARQLENIKKIDFYAMDKRGHDYFHVAADSLNGLLGACPQLEILNIGNPGFLMGVFFGYVDLSKFTNIKEIHLSDEVPNVLKILQEKFPSLKIVTSQSPAKEQKSTELEQENQLTSINPYTSSAYDKQALDNSFFNTVPGNPNLPFISYFPGIPPDRYRLLSWRPELDTLKPCEKFSPKDFRPVSSDLKDYTVDKACICHPCRKPVSSNDGSEIILPSLDAQEKIFNFKVVDAQGKLLDLKDLKIDYSPSTGFHRLRLPQAGDYSIHFQVAIPDPALKPTLPRHLDDLGQRYNAYKAAEGEPPKDFSSLRAFAEHVKNTGTGSCLHRSIAAYAELEEKYQDNLQIIENDVHAYIEVKIGEHWYQMNLGGYPARPEEFPIKVNVPPGSEVKSEAKAETKEEEQKGPVEVKQEVSPTVSLPPIEMPKLVINETSLEAILAGKDPALIRSDKDMGFKVFYDRLQDHYDSANIFVAHKPEDLSLSGSGITIEGKILENYTPFSNWLANKTEGAICVDVRDFDAAELAQLNDLLDGNLEKKQLPKGLRIFILDDPSRSYYGPDFRRRVPSKAAVKAEEEQSLLKPSVIPEHKAEDRIEIDLFNSPYWESLLMGTWKLNKASSGQAYSFQWQEGPLLGFLLQSPDSAKEIVFKNPPLEDPSFTRFLAELQSLKQLKWADQFKVLGGELKICASPSLNYDWENLAKQASLHSFSGHENKAYILSDGNILSFIQDPCYEFSKETNQMEPVSSYLLRCKQEGGFIDIVCAPGLSENTLAQLLTAAQDLDLKFPGQNSLKLRFFVPLPQDLPDASPLKHLTILSPAEVKGEEKSAATPPNPQVSWQLTEDVYCSSRKFLNENPGSSYYELSALDATELSRFPLVPERILSDFLAKGTLDITAPLAAILEKLQKGKTVVLGGKVPPALYEVLTSLALGLIEGENFKGRLIFLLPPEEATLVKSLSGQVPVVQSSRKEEKIELLQALYAKEKASVDAFILQEQTKLDQLSFAELEQQFLQAQMAKLYQPLRVEELQHLSDEEKADIFDQTRLNNVLQGLNLNPWVMLEGSTGIGKTYFMQTVLAAKERVITKLEEWLEAKPLQGEKLILVMDEASFQSELSGLGENFLERFKSLRANPPEFSWQGKDYTLTAEHKACFAYNPASYGAGRSVEGFLSEHALKVPMHALPDFYLRARTINPLLKKALGNQNIDLSLVADPLVSVYRWILANSGPTEVLITPREIKAMVSLIAGRVIQDGITDKDILVRLATEVAYLIGKQTLSDHPQKLELFNTAFPEPPSILQRKVLPEPYLEEQGQAYSLIADLLQARATLLSVDNTDLGLGGVILEGASGIGKSHFIQKIAEDYEKASGETVYRISANLSYFEKENLLREAFAKGALVFADEMNTNLWPNKLLNNFLMGLDEEGKPGKPPRVKPGFMMIATQNPPSFEGRMEEDPALRRRFIKLKLDWPTFQPGNKLEKSHYEEKLHGQSIFQGAPTAVPVVVQTDDQTPKLQ